MNHEEQVLWKLITNNNHYFETRQEEQVTGKSHDGRPMTSLIPVTTISMQTVLWERLRAAWPKLVAVAKGQASPEILPKPTEFPIVGFIGDKDDPGRISVSIGPPEEGDSEYPRDKRRGKNQGRKG